MFEKIIKKSQTYSEEIRKLKGANKYATIGFFYGSSKKKIQMLERDAGQKLSPTIHSFFAEHGGYYCKWDLLDAEDPGKNIVATGNTLQPDSIVNGLEHSPFKKKARYKGFLWDESDEPQRIKELEGSYYIFDLLGYGNFTLLKFEKGKDEPDLYLFSHPGDLHKLRIGFVDYIEMAVESRGVFFWQSHFLASEDAQVELHFQELIQTDFRRLFPTADMFQYKLLDEPAPEPSFYHLSKKKKYYEHFEAMVKELRKRDGFRVETFQIDRGSPIQCLNRAVIDLGIMPSDSFFAFFASIGGLTLWWNYRKDGDVIAEGDFRIPRLEEILGGPEFLWEFSRRWNYSVYDFYEWYKEKGAQGDPEHEQYKAYRLLYIEEDSDTIFRFVEGNNEPELFVLDGIEKYKLKVDFERYIECLLETRGLKYWQYFLTDPNELKDLETLPDFNALMKELFPEVDLSKYRTK